MKSALAFILFIIQTCCLYGQTPPTTVVQGAIDQFLETENPKDGLAILKSVSTAVPEVPDSLIADYYINLGICYGQMGIADSSFMVLEQAERLATQLQSDYLLVKVYNTQGLVYMGMGKYSQSLEAYQAAMNLAEGHEEERILKAIAKVYGNVGGIYYQLGDLEKAAATTQKGLELTQRLGVKSSQAYNHLRLALVYNDLNRLEKGIDHLEQARQFLSELGDTTTLVYAENSMGQIYEKQQKLEEAFIHYEAAHKLALLTGEQEEVAFTLLSMANVRLDQSRIASARNYANEALKYAQEHQYGNSVKRSYEVLYQCALVSDRYKEALDYRNLYVAMDDSLSGAEVQKQIAELETKYESAQKEAEIERLSLENELQKQEFESTRIFLIASFSGSVVILILILAIYYQRAKKQKAEREAQQLQIEALQKRLMDLKASPTSMHLELDQLNEQLHNELTEREYEVLSLSMEGKSNQEIAEQLYISGSTVKFHLRNVYAKLGVTNRKEAVKYVANA